jgi:lipooligosaccharide transport system ATP-binding protein
METARSSLILEARGLVKIYGARRVVDSLDITLDAGAMLSLLGPNGAGKTTTLRLLHGVITPEAGSIRYEGLDFGAHRTAIKRWIGVCSQDDTLDQDLSVRENLRMYASYFRPRIPALDDRIDELLRDFALEPYARSRPHVLSGGYRQRLRIARAIIHHPRILYLDEPTTGLDPRARMDLWELMDGLRAGGMSIILCTHYMDEAERLSDQVLVLSGGARIAAGTPHEVIGQLLGEHVLIVKRDASRAAEVSAWFTAHHQHTPAAILGELHMPLRAAQLADFATTFADVTFSIRPPSLDDLFIRLSQGT